MKIIVGIDISKDSFEAAKAGKAKTFANTKAGFAQLRKWSPDADLYVMEATGGYHLALADYLHEHGCNVAVVNPRMASHYARALGLCHKTDRADAKVLATYAERNEVPAYVPLAPEMRRLRRLVRHRQRLVGSMAEIKRQLKAPGIDAFEAKQMNAQIKFLKTQLEKLEREIYDLIVKTDELAKAFALLVSVPGLGPLTAIVLLAETGGLDKFASTKHLASFAGVHPRLKQSGTSLRAKPRMAKTGSEAIRKALYMSSLAAARMDGPCRALFLRLIEKGHPRMSALGAVMHKQLRIAFGVCRNKRLFSYEKTPLTTT